MQPRPGPSGRAGWAPLWATIGPHAAGDGIIGHGLGLFGATRTKLGPIPAERAAFGAASATLGPVSAKFGPLRPTIFCSEIGAILSKGRSPYGIAICRDGFGARCVVVERWP